MNVLIDIAFYTNQKKKQNSRKAIESKRKELEEKEKKLIEFDRQLQKRKEQMDQLEKSLQKVKRFNTLWPINWSTRAIIHVCQSFSDFDLF